MVFVAKQYVRVKNTVYVPGEFLPDNAASAEEIEWLISAGAVISTAPVADQAKPAEVKSDEENIDVMAGLVEEAPKKKTTRRKKSAN